MLKIGPHISISRGYTKALDDAEKIGANTFQFFSRNPRGGNVKKLNLEDIDRFNSRISKSTVGDILCHAPYTYNLCSKKDSVREFSQRSILEDLNRLDYIDCNLYNIHPGSHTGWGVEKAVELISYSLNKILEKNSNHTILLETMSGKGTEIGRSFDELNKIISKIESNENIGVCIDTCHIYSAGYNIVDSLEQVLKQFDNIVGLSRLKAIHLNDSLMGLGENKDRHAPLGEGLLGIKTIKNVLSNINLRNLPFYLETPHDLQGHKKEIKYINKIIKER